MKFLNKHFEEILIAILFALMSLIIGLQVCMRYIFNDSLSWSEELARYCFIWATYIGIAAGFKHYAHIRVDFFTDRFFKNFKHHINILAYIVVVVFSFFIIIEGHELFSKILRFNQRSSTLGIPMAYIYLAPVVGFSLTVLRLVQYTFYEIQQIRNKG